MAEIPVDVRSVGADRELAWERCPSVACCIVLDGMVVRYKRLALSGRRQILGIFVEGDMPDLSGLLFEDVGFSLRTLASSRVGFVGREDLRGLVERFPRIAAALWHESMIDASRTTEWLFGMGRRTADARLAHLACELFRRCELAGRTEGSSVKLPLTQLAISDVLGITAVHVHRILKDFKSKRLATWSNGTLTINDQTALERVAEFDPMYLHLGRR